MLTVLDPNHASTVIARLSDTTTCRSAPRSTASSQTCHCSACRLWLLVRCTAYSSLLLITECLNRLLHGFSSTQVLCKSTPPRRAAGAGARCGARRATSRPIRSWRARPLRRDSTYVENKAGPTKVRPEWRTAPGQASPAPEDASGCPKLRPDQPDSWATPGLYL